MFVPVAAFCLASFSGDAIDMNGCIIVSDDTPVATQEACVAKYEDTLQDLSIARPVAHQLWREHNRVENISFHGWCVPFKDLRDFYEQNSINADAYGEDA